MNEKIRVNIYVDKYAWEELPKYIACSKSNWINEQILKKISQHDDVADLERKINEISALVEGLQFDKENLETRKKELLDERKRNEQSFEIINNAMNTIRIVNENQGYIEKTRVEFFANKFNLSVEVLQKQILKENIKIKDVKQRDDTDTGESAKGGYVK